MSFIESFKNIQILKKYILNVYDIDNNIHLKLYLIVLKKLINKYITIDINKHKIYLITINKYINNKLELSLNLINDNLIKINDKLVDKIYLLDNTNKLINDSYYLFLNNKFLIYKIVNINI